MKKKPVIIGLTFVVSFFIFLNLIPGLYFQSKKMKFNSVNQMVSVQRELGQNDFLEKFATPNLAKSYCFYDLSNGPVKFSLKSGIYYWSLSIYDDYFSNLFHISIKDDPDIEKNVLIVNTKQAALVTKKQRSYYDKIIVSKSNSGVGVVRNFIKHWNKEKKHHSLLSSKCGTLVN